MDGLRGWASLSVVVFHFTYETFGERFTVFHEPVVALFAQGDLAVGVFLTLSGYVLTIGNWHLPRKPRVVRHLAKRYPRLMIPVLASTLLSWLLLTLNLTFNAEAGQIVNRPIWLSGQLAFEPDFLDALFYSTVRVFLVTEPRPYSPFLWTMIIELWGSWIVLLICLGERLLRYPYVVLLVLIAVLLALYPLAACLPLGAVLALLRQDGFLRSGWAPFGWRGAATVIAVLAVVTGTIVRLMNWGQLPLALLSVVIVAAVIAGPSLATILSGRVSQFFGRISFPIYLVQSAVLASFTSWLIIAAEQRGILNLGTAWAISLGSIAVSILCAVLFLPVERLTLWVTGRIDVLMTSRKKPVQEGAA